MKNSRIFLFVLVFALLVGCKPTETPQPPAPVEATLAPAPATTATPVAGISLATSSPSIWARYPKIPSCQSQEIGYDIAIYQDGDAGYGLYSQCGLLVEVCVDDDCKSGYVCSIVEAFKAPKDGWGPDGTTHEFDLRYAGEIYISTSFEVWNNGVIGKCDPNYIDLGD